MRTRFSQMGGGSLNPTAPWYTLSIFEQHRVGKWSGSELQRATNKTILSQLCCWDNTLPLLPWCPFTSSNCSLVTVCHPCWDRSLSLSCPGLCTWSQWPTMLFDGIRRQVLRFSASPEMDPEEILLPHLHGTLVVRIEEARCCCCRRSCCCCWCCCCCCCRSCYCCCYCWWREPSSPPARHAGLG